MLSDDTTDAVFTRVAAGDLAAFEAAYDRIFPRVLTVAYAVLRDYHLAEVVAQEVMVEIWRTAPTFDSSRGTVGGWAAIIAHRRAIDQVRSSQAARRRDHKAGTDPTVVSAEPNSLDVEPEQEGARVRFALASLTARQRDCILLAYYSGLNYRQVAQQLGLPEATVKSCMRSGLLLMQTVLVDPAHDAASTVQVVASA